MRPYAPVALCTAMSPKAPITVVIAQFDDLLARGLRELIDGDPNLAIVAGEVEHRRIPVVLRAHRPDVAILDAGALAKLAEIRELSAPPAENKQRPHPAARPPRGLTPLLHARRGDGLRHD
jgi:DNA-binding NarL/FixJ family response regulator